MDEKDKRVMKKIITHAESIVEETNGIADAEEFKANNDKSKAALFDLLQIGELAKDGLSEETTQSLTEIPWKQIYALRNRIVHGYASVDYQIIFETIQEDIPTLISKINTVIQ